MLSNQLDTKLKRRAINILYMKVHPWEKCCIAALIFTNASSTKKFRIFMNLATIIIDKQRCILLSQYGTKFASVFVFFVWHYQFTCLPNNINVAYIVDAMLAGDSFQNCIININDTISLTDSLVLTVHPTKSIFIPTQEITFVGFIFNLLFMMIKLTTAKAENIVNDCKEILQHSGITIWQFAQLISKVVARSGIYVALHYKTLETECGAFLKLPISKFDAKMMLGPPK